MTPAALIEAIAFAMNNALAPLRDMEPDELKAVIAACDKRTATNCWFREWDVAPLIRKEAKCFLSIRLPAAKDKAPRTKPKKP